MGHHLTQGTADSNQLWVEVTAGDDAGPFASSGELDEDRRVDPFAHFINSYVLDRMESASTAEMPRISMLRSTTTRYHRVQPMSFITDWYPRDGKWECLGESQGSLSKVRPDLR